MVQITEENSLYREAQKLQLDQEWVSLIKSAKNQGLSIDNVRNFLKEKGLNVNTSRN
ncbi:anti-repressor SinI family protein [Bacillus sp. FJAT-49732]|uniref:Anti-repressor SinI family protein n=1 Tax=Lederbergia citrisecunda TaxID=2833583 RepID=A0A942YP42_9BACI|nr:anti-repressor SinI family protein [Lederbergia citrisecunda]MBS4202370.1 anti-repressor SinI family protein [Lederbergia citrisecunda]